MDIPDPLWLEAARRGEPRAFRQLIDQHSRSLYAVCQRLLGDSGGAEDAVQEALLSAWKHLHQYDGRASLRSWLHRIAVNAALAIARTRAHAERQQALPLEAIGETVAAGEHHAPTAWLESSQQRERLHQALFALSPLERSAFVLKHVEQHALADIASRLESNVNAIKQAVFRAVRKLRQALGTAGTADIEESTA